MTLRIRYSLLALLGVAAVLVSLDWWIAVPEGRTAEYVGRQTCAECHAAQEKKWSGSDHDLAMDLATPEFVLGDFENTQLEHHGITSRMSRRGDEYFVATEGPDGQVAEFRVKYVFGFRPLQQYLAELEKGHIQVLPVSWDTEQKRWFYANPDEPFGPHDPLHWTGSAQNWNHMCAECHTTNFAKNYDVKTDTYHSSYSEIDVSCESCHGPGSLHVELAEARSLFWDRRYGFGLAKLKGDDPTTELETCAPCHSRRQRVFPEFQAGDRYSDHFRLALLDDHLYHADGQIDDEVYVYGSFTQSLMYEKGVRCTDCHDPHTTRVKFEDNRLCTQCHIPGKYDGPVHHHHAVGSRGARCVECHMPSKNYMVVDPRRDHSLRVPRPDLTVSIGTPNACNDCHTKEIETPAWAAEKVVEWYGPKRRQDPHYGEIIHAGRASDPAAVDPLIKLARDSKVGPIVRATAVSLLGQYFENQEARNAVERAAKDRDSRVRVAALRTLDDRPPTSPEQADELRKRVAPLLTDRFRQVRSEAARLLAGTPSDLLDAAERASFEDALKEYQIGVNADNDLAGAHMSLALLNERLNRTDAAVSEYRTAIRIEPEMAGARSNLANLLSRLGNEKEAMQLRIKEAELLERDAGLLPDSGILHYRLGLANYLIGREDKAVVALAKACELEPRSPDFLMALTLLYEKQRRWGPAIKAAQKLIALQPENRVFQQVLAKIQNGASRSQAEPGPQPLPQPE